MEQAKPQVATLSIQVWAKFLIMSAVGIFSFFITFTLGNRDTFLVNHIAIALKGKLDPYVYTYIIILAACGIADLYVRRSRFFKDTVNMVLSLTKISGFIVIIGVVMGMGPEAVLNQSVGPFVLKKLVFPISITIPVAALFSTLSSGFWTD